MADHPVPVRASAAVGGRWLADQPGDGHPSAGGRGVTLLVEAEPGRETRGGADDLGDAGAGCYLWYVDRALDSMLAIVSELGEELVNERPDLAGANSAYALVTHCCGVMADWGGYAIAGHPVDRDRAAEFVATGSVADLLETVRRLVVSWRSTWRRSCRPTLHAVRRSPRTWSDRWAIPGCGRVAYLRGAGPAPGPPRADRGHRPAARCGALLRRRLSGPGSRRRPG